MQRGVAKRRPSRAERYHQSHFIPGVSNRVTADCEWDRLHCILDKVGRT